jgi:hypothetical protein
VVKAKLRNGLQGCIKIIGEGWWFMDVLLEGPETSSLSSIPGQDMRPPQFPSR